MLRKRRNERLLRKPREIALLGNGIGEGGNAVGRRILHASTGRDVTNHDNHLSIDPAVLASGMDGAEVRAAAGDKDGQTLLGRSCMLYQRWCKRGACQVAAALLCG